MQQDVCVYQDHDADLVQKTLQYESQYISENTRRTYKSMWGQFKLWCHRRNICPYPATAEAISAYISDIGSQCSSSKIDVSIAAIEFMHKDGGVSIIGDRERYKHSRKGIKRAHPERSLKKKAKALSVVDLTILGRIKAVTIKQTRDKAIIMLCFFAALRRSELVGLDVEHVVFSKDGMELLFLHTKTSHEPITIMVSRAKNAEICPVKALEEWLAQSWIKSGPVFRPLTKTGGIIDKRLSGEAVSIITKQLFGEKYSGHSMRRGLISEEAKLGISVYEIAKHSRHKDFNVLLGYVEKERAFETSTTRMLGV